MASKRSVSKYGLGSSSSIIAVESGGRCRVLKGEYGYVASPCGSKILGYSRVSLIRSMASGAVSLSAGHYVIPRLALDF